MLLDYLLLIQLIFNKYMKIDIEHINGVACCFNRFVLIVTLYNI